MLLSNKKLSLIPSLQYMSVAYLLIVLILESVPSLLKFKYGVSLC